MGLQLEWPAMSKSKEKEEVPEVWTEKWNDGRSTSELLKIREPIEMSDIMAKFCVDAVDKAFAQHPDFDKDGAVIAAEVRKELEEKYDPCWQVVLGRNFGSHVTYQSNHFLNFYRGQVNVLNKRRNTDRPATSRGAGVWAAGCSRSPGS